MKKTFAILLAAAASLAMAQADTLGSYTFSKPADSAPTSTATAGSVLTLSIGSLTGSATTYKTTNTYLMPDFNVGNTAGSWTQSFTLTNNTDTAYTLTSITLDIDGLNSGITAQVTGGGMPMPNDSADTVVGWQSGEANKPVIITFSSDAQTESWTCNMGMGYQLSKLVITFDSPVTLAAAGETGNALDFSITAAHYDGSDKGSYPGLYAIEVAGSQAVPEPATATLSLLALAGLAARRRRK